MSRFWVKGVVDMGDLERQKELIHIFYYLMGDEAFMYILENIPKEMGYGDEYPALYLQVTGKNGKKIISEKKESAIISTNLQWTKMYNLF